MIMSRRCMQRDWVVTQEAECKRQHLLCNPQLKSGRKLASHQTGRHINAQCRRPCDDTKAPFRPIMTPRPLCAHACQQLPLMRTCTMPETFTLTYCTTWRICASCVGSNLPPDAEAPLSTSHWRLKGLCSPACLQPHTLACLAWQHTPCLLAKHATGTQTCLCPQVCMCQARQ